jgi:hypothetical protein
MGVVRGSIPRESISFCRCARRVVGVDVVVVGAEGFFGVEVDVEGRGPTLDARREMGEGDARDGFMRKGMWRSGLFLWLESSEWVCGERWLWRFTLSTRLT